MPAIYATQAPVATDTGAISLGFQSAPNVLYDRTLVGNTTYTISTAGTVGGETMSIVLRGAYLYSFASAVAIAWAAATPPVPQCSATAFDKIRFELLQDGTLLGTSQALGAAPAHLAPSGATLGASGGNGFVTLTGSALINGAALTSVPVYRGTTSSGEGATAIGTASISGSSYTYTDSTVSNGTTYYYTANPANSVGSAFASVAAAAAASGNQASATPTYVSPTHYLVGTSSSNVTCPETITQDLEGGFLDVIYYIAPSTVSGSLSFGGKWPNSTTPSASNAEFIGQTNGSGNPVIIYWETGAGTYTNVTCSASLSSVISNGQDIFLQMQVNLSTSSVTPVQGNTATLASGSARFSYSTNGTNWTQLGSLTTGLSTGGFTQVGTGGDGSVAFGSSPPYAVFTGKYYKATVRDGSGAIRYNPNLTALASGQTGIFTDTAATGNTWTINGTIN
jgi:hypothetical protein